MRPDRIRRRRVWPVIATIAAIAATLSVAARAQQQFRAATDVITVDVSVTLNHRSVKNLRSSDFQLLDNGVAQSLDAVSIETLPIDVTLVLDVSTSVDGDSLQRLKTAVRDIAKQLNARDRIRLISMASQLREVFDFQPGGSKPPVETLRAGGATSLYDGLATGMMLVRPPDRRHLIIAFTDGIDSVSILTPTRLRELALSSDAVLHVVLAPTVRTMNLPSPVSQLSPLWPRAVGSITTSSIPAVAKPLTVLATMTGGTWVPLSTLGGQMSFAPTFSNLVNDFRTSYTLRYTLSGVAPEGWHEVVVSLTRPGHFDIRARQGYYGR